MEILNNKHVGNWLKQLWETLKKRKYELVFFEKDWKLWFYIDKK